MSIVQDRIQGLHETNRFVPVGLSAILLAGLLISGCQTPAERDPVAGGGGLVGKWVSADNIFTAEFGNGVFSSVANDTGALLSTGSYIVLSAQEIKLSWFGNLTKQENSAVCQRPDEATLVCQDIQGRQFTMRKLSPST